MSESIPHDPLQWLTRVLAEDPDRTLILLADGRRLSYRWLDALSSRMAHVLASLHVKPGDRVVAQVDKSPEAVALYVACLKTGAVFVPLNTAYTLAELDYFLGDAAPRVAVLRPASLSQVSGLSHRTQFETLGSASDGSLLARAAAVSFDRFEPFKGDASTLAALLYTSGTTGRSKGAMLTRGNLFSNAETLVAAWKFSSADVLLHALPIFHVHGLFVAINSVLASGSSMVFLW